MTATATTTTTTTKKLTMSVPSTAASSQSKPSLFLLLLLASVLMTRSTNSHGTRSSNKIRSNVHINDDDITTTTSSRIILSFDEWMEFHDKSYTSEEEYLKRRQIWIHNKERIVQVHNKAFDEGLTSYRMSIQSPFSDLTCEEFSNFYLMPKKPRDHCALAASASTASATSTSSSSTIKRDNNYHQQSQQQPQPQPQPQQHSYPSIDWRDHGVMTKVKDQGRCGSCWTFSTTGTLEAHTCLAHHRHDCYLWAGLSEQQLVDCSTPFGENSGCNGGWPSSAFEYIKYNNGIESETSYPYHGKDQNCSAVPSPTNDQNQDDVGAKVTEVYNITYQDEDDFQNVLATVGPISFAFQVSPDFRFYSSGVYDSYNATTNKRMCHGDEQYLNHAVVAVGMGIVYEDDDENDDDSNNHQEIPYYIVRNSWSSDWAMEGYFWLKRGENLCGVSDCASFPIVPVTAHHPSKSLDDPQIHQNQTDRKSDHSQPKGHGKEPKRLNQQLHLRSSS